MCKVYNTPWDIGDIWYVQECSDANMNHTINIKPYLLFRPPI